MLVMQSFRVHQIIPHIAKKKKRLYLFNLQKLIVLHFDDNNQKENQFGVNQDFTINKLIMQIKVLALFLFTAGTLKGYNAQVFRLCSSIAGKNYTTCFLNYTPKQKRSYLDEFTLSLVDDWVLGIAQLLFMASALTMFFSFLVQSFPIPASKFYPFIAMFQINIILPCGFSSFVWMFRMQLQQEYRDTDLMQ